MSNDRLPPPLPLDRMREPAPRWAPWMAIAEREVGVREVAGDGSNKRIIEYLSTVMPSWNPLLRDSTAWCSAFVNWTLRETFDDYYGHRARARAWMQYGEAVSPDAARYGDIVVLERGIPLLGGHVGFFLRFAGDQVELLGGNQRNAVCAALYPRAKILAVRRPAGVRA